MNQKADPKLYVTLSDVVPTVTEGIDPDSKCFQLTLEADGGRIAVNLTPSELQALGLQCVAHMPAVAPQYSVASVEEGFRLTARGLRELDDRSMQLLLRECQSDQLIAFLWYMKDPGLLKLVMRNMSSRAAEMLMDDLTSFWWGKNPDNTVEANAIRGRDATLAIVQIARRLIREGQLANVFGEAE